MDKKRAVTVALTGFVLQVIGHVVAGTVPIDAVRSSGGLLVALGFAIFLAGCVLVARAKGRPWTFGLLGLLSWVGLLILWFAVSDAAKPTARPA